MCSCDDWDPPSCFVEVTLVARKEHSCVECGETITKGDLYRRSSGVWDGRPDSFKTCGDCATVVNLAHGLEPGFCYAFGTLHETVEECLYDYLLDEGDYAHAAE